MHTKEIFGKKQKDYSAPQAAPSTSTEVEENKKNSLSGYTLEELVTTQESLEEDIEEISATIDNMNIAAYENIKILSDSDATQEDKDNAIEAGKKFRKKLKKLNKERDNLREALSGVKEEKEKHQEN